MIKSEINSKTEILLVIGDPISHSLSPRMHNVAYSYLGLNFLMAASKVATADLTEAVAGIRALKIRGLACTMPHKSSLLKIVDHVDLIAQRIGAINTVINKNGLLYGYSFAA